MLFDSFVFDCETKNNRNPIIKTKPKIDKESIIFLVNLKLSLFLLIFSNKLNFLIDNLVSFSKLFSR